MYVSEVSKYTYSGEESGVIDMSSTTGTANKENIKIIIFFSNNNAR